MLRLSDWQPRCVTRLPARFDPMGWRADHRTATDNETGGHLRGTGRFTDRRRLVCSWRWYRVASQDDRTRSVIVGLSQPMATRANRNDQATNGSQSHVQRGRERSIAFGGRWDRPSPQERLLEASSLGPRATRVGQSRFEKNCFRTHAPSTQRPYRGGDSVRQRRCCGSTCPI